MYKKRFSNINEACDFAIKVKGKVTYNVNVRDLEKTYIVEWDTPQKPVLLLFKDIWEHYKVQYKDTNTNTQELYSIEALGFLKALRLLYPEHITEINKEIAIVLSELMIKVLGEDK